MSKSRQSDVSFGLLAFTFVVWICLSLWSWTEFRLTVPDAYGGGLRNILLCLHIPWMMLWLWGIHNFMHSALSYVPWMRSPARPGPMIRTDVAILYTTCDDFDPEACTSCLVQSHPNTRLVICDDSRTSEHRRRIDEWVAAHGSRAVIVRRSDRHGFKAGNLNHAVEGFVHEEFFLVCDADEVIPCDFIERLLRRFTSEDIAFVQASHTARTPHRSRFEAMLAPTVDLFYKHCLPLRARFGFVSCFGHGVLIRRSAWRKVGGFPEIVSEDIGFACRVPTVGLRGVYAEDVVAEEAYPETYTAFCAKYRKIVGGTIQFFREEARAFLRSPLVSWTEKTDLLLTFSWCFLGLITMIGILGGLVISYLYALAGWDRLPSWLLIIYLIGPLTPLVPLLVRAAGQPFRYGSYAVTAATAYTSLLPVLTWEAAKKLLGFGRPVFTATGWIAQHAPRLRYHRSCQMVGLAILVGAVMLRSPALAPGVGIAMMIFLGPFMCFTERSGWLGFLACNVACAPFLTIAVLLLAT